MAVCGTRDFGEMEYAAESVIRFPAGLPGFEDEHEFVLIQQPRHQPVLFLQSIKTSALCFLLVPVPEIDRGYALQMRVEDLELIGLDPNRQPSIGHEVFCGAIIAAAEDEAPSVNLRAPVVIRLRTLEAVQAIQEGTRYSHCHPLAPAEMEMAC